MTAHNRVEFDVQDSQGNLYIAGVQVRWISEVDLSVPQLYSDFANASPIGNPFSVAPGNSRVQFYSPGGRFRLDLSLDGGSTWVNARRDFPVGTSRELDVESLYAAGTVVTAMLADQAVTYQKIQNVSANKLLGNPTGSAAAPSEIAIGGTLFWSGSTLGAGMPRGGIAGLIMSNNGSDATNDIDITDGTCRNSTNAFDITLTARTKQLDVNWAPGTNQGMRNSAAAIANGTYHIYAVAKADGTSDIYAHASAVIATVIAALQAEPGGSSYVYARRIGSIVRASAAILAFTQRGDWFDLVTPVRDLNQASPGTSALTVTLASIPTGIVVQASVTSFQNNGGAITYLSALTQADLAPSTTAAPLFTGGNSSSGATPSNKYVFTNTSAQIRARTSDGATTWVLVTHGWMDRRGRDD